jgi:hypothetical protein
LREVGESQCGRDERMWGRKESTFIHYNLILKLKTHLHCIFYYRSKSCVKKICHAHVNKIKKKNTNTKGYTTIFAEHSDTITHRIA